MESTNILVVDDDHEIADLVAIHLKGEGYKCLKHMMAGRQSVSFKEKM